MVTTTPSASYVPLTMTAAGSSQANAPSASGSFTIITASTAGSGVRIAPLLNQLQIIYNGSDHPIKIWPIVGMTLLPAAPNAAMNLTKSGAMGLIVTSSSRAYVVFTDSIFA